MTPESLLNAFAQAVVAQSFDRAEKMLAPWVKSALPVGGLKRVVREMRGDNPPAVEFELEELPDDDPASMREGAGEFPIPVEITDENFRGSWQIEFQPDADEDVDIDYSYAFYLALVADGKELKIGYLEPVD